MSKEVIGSAMVLGGGIAGMQAALDLAFTLLKMVVILGRN